MRTPSCLILWLCIAACAADPVSPPDPEDGIDDDLPGGKPDTGGLSEGTPEACGVLKVANLASLDELDHDAALAARAADNIVHYRLGDDQSPATSDDETFDTLHELDAVPYVGPIAFAKLLAYATTSGHVDECGDPPPIEPTGCTGVNVPGDYASLQTALDALANAGQDATICLGEGVISAPDTFRIYDPGNHGKALHIIGRSRDLTRITTRITVASGWATVTMRGVHLDVPDQVSLSVQHGPPHFELSESRLAGSFAASTGYSSEVEVFIDRCEIGRQQQGTSIALVSNQKTLTAHVSNSYLLGELSSQTWESTGWSNTMNLDVVNNTFVGASGVDLEDEITATIANNIFTGATTYAMSWDAEAEVLARNNALWGNAANYGRFATEGVSYVKVDCQLAGTGSVPALSPGSPCRGAGDPSLAPAHDFHGTARGTSVDIGAVEHP